MTQPDSQQRQLQGLAMLVQLQRKARACEDSMALAFTMVNETHSLTAYRQAALWAGQPVSRVVALSGVAQLDVHAPYPVWLQRLCEWLAAQDDPGLDVEEGRNPFRFVGAEDVPEALAFEWGSWYAPYALWLPLFAPNRRACIGGLLFAKDSPWLAGEAFLLAELADEYGYVWRALHKHRDWRQKWLSPWRSNWLKALPLLLLLPVRQSVLAPAEVVAINPTLIRAPMEGVVGEFQVHPNQPVEKDQLLLTLVNIDIANKLKIVRQALAVAEAEYRSTAQLALLEAKSKADLNVLKNKIDQHLAEVAYMEDQLNRSQIKAPQAGIAIFTDQQDWLGKPVAVGERIMQLADPQAVELQLHLPVADLISLEPGAEVVMFLNNDPQNPLQAALGSVSYRAELTPDDVMAYRLKASFAVGEAPPRIGLKGTAKVYGNRVSLFYYLFRRPMAGMRQWLGL